jgi:hypothetical protein
VHNYVVPFTSHGKDFDARKPISRAKLPHVNFFAINFTVSSHVLSSVGDTLK